MYRPIAISLSPNAERDDILLAFKTILSPRKWFDEKEVLLLEQEFASRFGPGYKALAINSGRSAEYIILKSLGIGKGDEVAIQAFTCVAVPNSILWIGSKPSYIDIEDSFNMDLEDIEKKKTRKMKAIIIQHTFGNPADLKKIKKFAQMNNIFLIEDCSHSLGASFADKPVGSSGDFSFFSFGRDKVISSVFGGMVLVSNDRLYRRLKYLRDRLSPPSIFWILQQLFHPIAFSIILPIYNLKAGKVLLWLLQKLGLLSKAVYPRERKGLRPTHFPQRMPGGLAILARNQLKKLDRFNAHRKEIARIYETGLSGMNIKLPLKRGKSIWLRYPIRVENSEKIYEKLKREGILLGNWYKGTIMPVEDLNVVGYKKDSCPKAEFFSRKVLNLPTNIAIQPEDARKIVGLLKKYV